MSASGTLDLANYTTVWNDNFADDTSLNYNLFPVAWGNGDDFSFGNGGLTLTSYASEGWSAAGFMQADASASDGQGYGLYSATFSADAGQGAGICIVMWPANNVWPGAEIDLTEDWSNTDRQSGNATIHWAGAGNSNQYQTYSFNANMTQPTTVAMDWEPGSLTFYVNGQEVFQYTGPNVPTDAANGGVNETFGAEVTAAGDAPVSSSVSLNLYDMSYSTYNGSGGSSSSGSGTGTGSGGSTGTTPPGTSIDVSNPGTVLAASAGAPVTVTETISDPGLTTAYVMVMNSANQGEDNWQAVSLNSAGVGTFSAQFENTGDYIVAVDNPTDITDQGWSSAVTITEPSTGSGTGTGSGSSSGSGSSGSTGGTTATGPTDIALTGDNLTSSSQAWTVIGTLSATDSSAVSFALGDDPGHLFSIDGDKLLINQAMPADPAASYDVGIIATDTTGAVATQDITVAVTSASGGSSSGSGSSGSGSSGSGSSGSGSSGSGSSGSGGGTTAAGPTDITLTGDNLTSSSQAWTVIGTLSATDSTAVSFALGDDPGHLFSIDGNKLLINQAMPANPAASYDVGIIAINSTGAVATQDITVSVTGASGGTSSGGTSATSVSATDDKGKTASLPLGTGTQTLAASTTGLAGAITEKTASGVTDFVTASGSGVTGLAIKDAAGKSWQTDGFSTVSATLSGATAGSLAIDGAKKTTVALGSGNYTVRVTSLISTATVSMTAGSGTDRMTFVGAGKATFTAGGGSDTIVGGQGGNTVTFGTGTSQVSGGSGADTYIFKAGDGLQDIATFNAAKGDVLDIAKSLKSSLHESSSGGSTLLTFGTASHGILLQGVSSFDTAQIHWT